MLGSLRPGFLLLEALIAIAVLGFLIIVITTQISNTLRWQVEARQYIHALNTAASLIDKINAFQKIHVDEKKELNGCGIAMQTSYLDIDQESIDKIIPREKHKTSGINKKDAIDCYKILTVDATINTPDGNTRKVSLLTGVLEYD